jgi:hypothetical protein
MQRVCGDNAKGHTKNLLDLANNKNINLHRLFT